MSTRTSDVEVQVRSSSYRKKAAVGASSHHHNHGSKAHYVHGGRLAPKMLVGLFAFPPQPPKVTFAANSRVGGEDAMAVAPKRPSCISSNLQPVNNAHYDEAISDCVKFFHRSARVDVRSRPSSSSHF
ncbi:hypothetical protein VPH35_128012 [Triticum aestivum]